MTVSAYLAGRTLGYWIMMSRTMVTADMRTKHMCLLTWGVLCWCTWCHNMVGWGGTTIKLWNASLPKYLGDKLFSLTY